MYTTREKDKIEKICQMILEVASGNFAYRIERSDRDDPLETVVVLLNMMAEEIRESFHHFALVNPHETYKQIAQMTFVLDDRFMIRNFNSCAHKILGLQKKGLYGNPFGNLLTEESKEQWEHETTKIKNHTENQYHHTLRLFFSSTNSLTVPSLCSISTLALKKDNEKLYLVTALQTIVQSREKEERIQQALHNLKQKMPKSKNPSQLLYRENDKRKIQEIYNHILNYSEEPLPSLKKLAHRFGTNEFKLKLGFRQLYNTTVFRFQKDQRLRRARSFILNSDLALMRISEICGFRSFPHFSKVFKIKYGYNPSELRGRNLE